MAKQRDPEALAAADARQRRVYTDKEVGIVIGTAHVVLAIVVIVYWNFALDWGVKNPKHESVPERIAYAIRLAVWAIIPLLAAMIQVLYGRVTNRVARNPLSGHEYLVEKSNRILTNTVEQTLLYAVNLFALTLLIPKSHLYLVPLFVGLFVVGRLAFQVGYSIHPRHRGYGFVWSFLPTFVVFCYNLYKVCCG